MILSLSRNTAPVWKSKFKNISKVTPEIKNLVKDMKETLDLTSGVGLAAPQVGEDLRLFIVSYGRLHETFINPKITFYGKETDSLEEGCLSVPCFRGQVKRSTLVNIEYTNLKGERKQVKLSGFYARIIQHEYDHLSSIFYTDRIKSKKNLYSYTSINIVYFSSDKFGLPTLNTVFGQQLVGEMNIQLVVTGAGKPSGRGKELSQNIIRKQAENFNLPVFEVETIKNNQKLVGLLKKLNPDLILVASFGHILSNEILKTSKKGALNVHPSLLPKYRGASPIQSAIRNGDRETGVTIMKMNEKMDEGDVLLQVKTRILPKETYETLSPKLASVGANLILHTLHLYTQGKLKERPQNHKKATYTKILKKEDGFIDWRKPPANLNNLIQAYHPWPGVWTRYNDKILKLLPGKKVQLEGKEPVTLKQFVSGHPDFTLTW